MKYTTEEAAGILADLGVELPEIFTEVLADMHAGNGAVVRYFDGVEFPLPEGWKRGILTMHALRWARSEPWFSHAQIWSDGQFICTKKHDYKAPDLLDTIVDAWKGLAA